MKKKKVSRNPIRKEGVRRKWSTSRTWKNLVSEGAVVADFITSKFRCLPFFSTQFCNGKDSSMRRPRINASRKSKIDHFTLYFYLSIIFSFALGQQCSGAPSHDISNITKWTPWKIGLVDFHCLTGKWPGAHSIH